MRSCRPGAWLRRVTRSARATASPSDADEPNPGKATVELCAAAEPGGTRPRELSGLTALSSGGVTMLLDRLEDAGLVQHVTGRPPDRRAVTITLTDPGRHDLDTRLDRADQHLDQFRSAFPAIDPSAHSPNGAGTGSQQH